MNRFLRTWVFLIGIATLLVLIPIPGTAGEAKHEDSPLISAIRAEIARGRTLVLPGMPSAHHIAVSLLGEEEVLVEASLGAVFKQDRNLARILKVEVRVGTPAFDSGNFLGMAEEPITVARAPLDQDTIALRHTLWLLMDRAYKAATEVYEAKRAHSESMTRSEDELDDFAPAPVERFRSNGVTPIPATASYVALAKSVSEVFLQHPEVYRSVVRIRARTRTRTLVDSAGTSIEDATNFLRVEIVAHTQAEDGMVLADHASFASQHFVDLPPLEELREQARTVARRLEQTRVAPVVEDYAGPVLFEGRAAPQLLRFLMAEDLSATPSPGTPMGADEPAGTFQSRVNWRVLPLGFDLIADPTVDRTAGFPLVGGYAFDDEGVRARQVQVVEQGRLMTLLSSRTPSKTVDQSNGHGRAGVTGDARGRASNLWLRSKDGLPSGALQARLLAMARKEGLNHAFVVAGFDEPSLTNRVMLVQRQATPDQVLPRPTEVYRIVSGKNPELVRGATLQGLRSRDLRHVVASGKELFGYSYLASASPVRSPSYGGELPTSIVSPALLLPDVDVVGPPSPHPLPPILGHFVLGVQ